MFRKLKSLVLTDQWFYGTLILLVGVISFTLGRMSTQSGAKTEPLLRVEAEKTTSSSSKADVVTITPVQTAALPQAVAVVASKSGTKYHLPTCPGAKQIKEENKLFFATISEAEAAGYKRAANCP